MMTTKIKRKQLHVAIGVSDFLMRMLIQSGLRPAYFSSVLKFKRDKSKQSRKPEMRQAGGGRGIMGLDSAGVCGEAPRVSYRYGTCRASRWLLHTVGGLSPQGCCEAAVLLSNESLSHMVRATPATCRGVLDLLGSKRVISWAWKMQSGSYAPDREWRGSCWDLSPSRRTARATHHLQTPARVERPTREMRVWWNAQHYAHCPLAAGSHFLFRSAGSISQR